MHDNHSLSSFSASYCLKQEYILSREKGKGSRSVEINHRILVVRRSVERKVKIVGSIVAREIT